MCGDKGKRLGTVGRLQDFMVEVTEQGNDKLAADRSIINNQYGCHVLTIGCLLAITRHAAN